jgi:Flp pilus assembly protein TadG
VSVRQRDRGQAAVEFAIALPLVVVLVLGVLHVVVVARDQLAIELAAREGARAAAVAAAPDVAATRAARAATTLRPLGVATSRNGSRVTVVVSHRSDPGMPMIGTLIGGVELDASVTMEREPP